MAEHVFRGSSRASQKELWFLSAGLRWSDQVIRGPPALLSVVLGKNNI